MAAGLAMLAAGNLPSANAHIHASSSSVPALLGGHRTIAPHAPSATAPVDEAVTATSAAPTSAAPTSAAPTNPRVPAMVVTAPPASPATSPTASPTAPVADTAPPAADPEPAPVPEPEPAGATTPEPETTPGAAPAPVVVKAAAAVEAVLIDVPPAAMPEPVDALILGPVEQIIATVWGDLTGSAMAVAHCESTMNPEAIGSGRYYGLFQIARLHEGLVNALGYTWDQILDPYVNAVVAKALFDASGGWGPWGCRSAA